MRWWFVSRLALNELSEYLFWGVREISIQSINILKYKHVVVQKVGILTEMPPYGLIL